MRPTDNPTENPAAKARLVPEETWIDFVERELDETFEQDLSLLLMNSQADKHQVDDLTKLRGLIKSSDNVFLPEDGRVYEALHDRIMAATANMQPGTAVRDDEFAKVSIIGRFLNKQVRVTTVAVSALAIAVSAWFGMQSQTQSISSNVAAVETPNEAVILAQAAQAEDSINDEVLSVISEDELLVDAASQKIAAMSDQDYAALLQHLRD